VQSESADLSMPAAVLFAGWRARASRLQQSAPARVKLRTGGGSDVHDAVAHHALHDGLCVCHGGGRRGL